MALQTSGAISLNDIHIEVNGTSGTTCSINDADIRGLIDKGRGAQRSFNEIYVASNITHIVASGGSTTTSGNYKFHIFNSSGTFTISTAGVGGSQYTTVDYICIAGGGAGGNAFPGGGAGGYRVGTFTGNATSRSITIGGGGTGNSRAGTNSNGSNSSIAGVVTSTGGGRSAQGRAYSVADAAGSGGSGGGGNMWNTPAGSGASTQGNRGGNGKTSPGSNEGYLCGGGGGGKGCLLYTSPSPRD